MNYADLSKQLLNLEADVSNIPSFPASVTCSVRKKGSTSAPPAVAGSVDLSVTQVEKIEAEEELSPSERIQNRKVIKDQPNVLPPPFSSKDPKKRPSSQSGPVKDLSLWNPPTKKPKSNIAASELTIEDFESCIKVGRSEKELFLQWNAASDREKGMILEARNMRLEGELWDKTDKLIIVRDILLEEARDELRKLKEANNILQAEVNSLKEEAKKVEDLKKALEEAKKIVEERKAAAERVPVLEGRVSELEDKVFELEGKISSVEQRNSVLSVLPTQVEELNNEVAKWKGFAQIGYTSGKEKFAHTISQLAILNPSLKYDVELVNAQIGSPGSRW